MWDKEGAHEPVVMKASLPSAAAPAAVPWVVGADDIL